MPLSRSPSVASIATSGDGSHANHPNAAASLCLALVTTLRWSAPKLATRLNVPVMVVEECLRLGKASPLLHAHLVTWVRESGEVPAGIPSRLIAAVLAEDPRGSLEEDDDFFDAMAGLDDGTQEHFRCLRQSVGHNFISVLNDPNEGEGPKEWSNWIGNAVFEAFDYGGPAGKDDSQAPYVQQAQAATETLRAMLSTHQPHARQFDPYLDMIHGPYNENRTVALQCDAAARKRFNGAETVDDIPEPVNVRQEFFDEKFDLGRLIADIGEDDAALVATIEMLEAQEEEVEAILSTHVHLRSKEFFEASLIFDTLHDDVSTTLGEVRHARRDVICCGEAVVEEFMGIAQAYRQRANLKAILDVSTEAEAVVKAGQRAKVLLLEERFSDAVAAIKSSEEALQCGRCSDLRALYNYPTHLSEMKRNVRNLLLAELERELHHSRWTISAGFDKVKDLTSAASQLGSLESCIQQYRVNACEGAWVALQRALMSAILSLNALPNDRVDAALTLSSDSSQSPEAQKAFLACIQPVKPSLFVHLLSRCLDSLREFTAVAHEHALVVLGMALTNTDDPSSPVADVEETDYFKNHMFAVQVAVQNGIVGLFEARQNEQASLRLQDMEAMLRVSFDFVKVQEEQGIARVTGKSGGMTALRSQLAAQALRFVNAQHDKQQQKLLMVMSQEQWTPEDTVEGMFQQFCDQLCDASDKAVEEAQRLSVENGVTSAPRGTEADAPESCEGKLVIPNEDRASEADPASFSAANSLLMLLQTLGEYDRHLCAFPFLAAELVMRIHDAIKLYDGQCAVMVLGAGAVDQGLLQQISVANLALASECMAFLAAFIPRLRSRLTRLCPPGSRTKAALEPLLRVERDLLEHRNEFYAKIVAMVREKLESMAFDPMQWKTAGQPTIMALLKEVARLLRSTKNVLSSSSLAAVMLPTLHQCCIFLRDKIKAAPLYNSDVKAHVWQDLQLFNANVEKFGFSVSQAVKVATIHDGLAAGSQPLQRDDPAAQEEELRRFFLPEV